MLRTKLFKGFMLVVVLFTVLSAVLAIRTIKDHIMTEAQNRVRLDLGSAWAVCDSRLKQTETVVRLVAAKQSVIEAGKQRLRPVLATGITDAAGFIPMALSTGVGAEVQRPLATVVVGGVLTDTVLTLFVLPILYTIVHGRGKRQSE